MKNEATVVRDRNLSTDQLAAWLGVAPGTLRFWRWEGRGPKWFRLGPKTVKYRESDVREWLDSQYAEVNGAE